MSSGASQSTDNRPPSTSGGESESRGPDLPGSSPIDTTPEQKATKAPGSPPKNTPPQLDVQAKDPPGSPSTATTPSQDVKATELPSTPPKDTSPQQEVQEAEPPGTSPKSTSPQQDVQPIDPPGSPKGTPAIEDVKPTKAPGTPPKDTSPEQDAKATKAPGTPPKDISPEQDAKATKSPDTPPGKGVKPPSKKGKKGKKCKRSDIDEYLAACEEAKILGTEPPPRPEGFSDASSLSPVREVVTAPIKTVAVAEDRPPIDYSEEAVSKAVELCMVRFESAVLKSEQTPQSRGAYKTLGLTTEARKEQQDKLFSKLIHFEQNELIALMKRLWDKEEREYQYLVLDLLKHASVTIIRAAGHSQLFDLLEYIVTTKSDTDTVDVLATKHLTTLAYLEPGETWPRMDTWINQPSPWLKRAAIMHQSGMGDFTDRERLFRYCRMQFQKPYQFPELINSAIEFALRKFATTYHTDKRPDGVEQTVEFINENLNFMSLEQKKTLCMLKAKLEPHIKILKEMDRQKAQAQKEENPGETQKKRKT